MPITAYHKVFMSVMPPNLRGNEGPHRVEGWLKEIEKDFRIINVSNRLKVRFGTNMLVDDAESWQDAHLEVRFGGEEPAWEEFVE